MKKNTIMLSTIALFAIATIGCTSKHEEKTQAQASQPKIDEMELSVELNQPDENFYDAILAFDDGENLVSADYIEKGISFVEMIKDESSEKDKPALEKQITKLRELEVNISEDKVTSELDLRKAFEQTNMVLAGRAITETESFIELGDMEKSAKTSHAASYYLHQAERHANKDTKHVYHESIDEIENIQAKTKEGVKSDDTEIKLGFSKIKTYLTELSNKL